MLRTIIIKNKILIAIRIFLKPSIQLKVKSNDTFEKKMIQKCFEKEPNYISSKIFLLK